MGYHWNSMPTAGNPIANNTNPPNLMIRFPERYFRYKSKKTAAQAAHQADRESDSTNAKETTIRHTNKHPRIAKDNFSCNT